MPMLRCLHVTSTHKPTTWHSDPHHTSTQHFVHCDNFLLRHFDHVTFFTFRLCDNFLLWHSVSKWTDCLASQKVDVLSHCDIPTHCNFGGGSTDLRLYTSTKLKNVNCWLYLPMHKKQNLYFNNMKKLYWTFKIFNCQILMYGRFLLKGYFSVKCHFKAFCLIETKSFIVKVVNNF